MATICCICGKQQHGMLPSYPLSTEHRELQICGDCHQLLSQLEGQAQHDPERYQAARTVLHEYIGGGSVSPTAADVLTAQLYHCDTIAAPFLAEQKKKSLHKKSAVQAGISLAAPGGNSSNLTSSHVKKISWVILALGLLLGVVAGATVTPMFYFGGSAFNVGAAATVMILGLLLFLGCRLFAAHLSNQERTLAFLYAVFAQREPEEKP